MITSSIKTSLIIIGNDQTGHMCRHPVSFKYVKQVMSVLYSFLIIVHDVREVRPCCLRHCAQDFQNNALRRIILRLLSNTKWILKSFMALSFEFFTYFTLYSHSISLFVPSLHALPFKTCFLHSTILLLPLFSNFTPLSHHGTPGSNRLSSNFVYVYIASLFI